ncbi:hypothetical protein [Pseudomonas plecoglossicida]|uniref:hypothetical protein n=1 Tax=Pseudomonas plecoglossicida TaxID=70775 RepID=UPI003CF65FF9
MVIAGDLTTGSLVAASMLSSRMMAPLAQLTHVLTRWQQAKVALQGLDKLMQSPVDHPKAKPACTCLPSVASTGCARPTSATRPKRHRC